MSDQVFFATFKRHLAMAMAWGLVFVAVFSITAVGVKQEVKEMIQYVALNFDSGNSPCPLAYHQPLDVQAQHEKPEPEAR
ncbi:MAG: hypothetical protein GXP53_13670 [Deltaproteobacteria bacterium]|nr:hypothetical protein [Deltaproteobacteria bacterium]